MHMMDEWIMTLWQPRAAAAAGMDVSSPEAGERREDVKACHYIICLVTTLAAWFTFYSSDVQSSQMLADLHKEIAGRWHWPFFSPGRTVKWITEGAFP